MHATKALPQRLSRADSKERTLEALLEAAKRTFIADGYQESTIDAIAAAAGFTKGAVYAHFRSKDELLGALLERTLRRNAEQLDALIDETRDSPALLMHRFGGWIDDIDDVRETQGGVAALGAELEIEARHNPKVRAALAVAISEHEQSVARILDRYFSILGRDPPLPVEELAPALIVAAEGFAIARKARRSDEPKAAPLIRSLLGLPCAPDRPQDKPHR